MNPKCPKCNSCETVKRGSRRGLKRFLCKKCHGSFSVDHRRKAELLWIQHVDGVPIRKLADERKLSIAQTYQKLIAELNRVVENVLVTKIYCDPEKFCGILIVDGKFIKVRGYKQKIPFIYGIDYLTHDIPIHQLSQSESEVAFEEFFKELKTNKYPLHIVVCDDRSSLEKPLKKYYPEAIIQHCQNHYVNNIREALHVRTAETHQHFFNSIKKHIFDEYSDEENLKTQLNYIFEKHAKKNSMRIAILKDIYKRREKLFSYTKVPHCPKNTNLIELYNSHLNARVRSIKGFKSFANAERWCNAYIIRRRTKSLTDCRGKFKPLNGKPSLQNTLKKEVGWTEIFLEKTPKTER